VLSQLITLNWVQLVAYFPVGNYLIATLNSPALRRSPRRWVRYAVQFLVCALLVALFVWQSGAWGKLKALDLGSLVVLFLFATTVSYRLLRDSGVQTWEEFTSRIGGLILGIQPVEAPASGTPLPPSSTPSPQPPVPATVLAPTLRDPVEGFPDLGDE